MKLYQWASIAVLIAIVSGCNHDNMPKTAPAPVGPIDHSLNGSPQPNVASACPQWNGLFVTKTGLEKTVITGYDMRGSLVIHIGNTIWVVNGKPEYLPGNPHESYSAYCTGDAQNRMIIADVYQSGVIQYSVKYSTNLSADVNGNAFDMAITNPDGSARRPVVTYTGVGAVPGPTPTPTPTPTSSPSPASPVNIVNIQSPAAPAPAAPAAAPAAHSAPVVAPPPVVAPAATTSPSSATGTGGPVPVTTTAAPPAADKPAAPGTAAPGTTLPDQPADL